MLQAVASNTAKLALSGLTAGSQLRVTGEGDRIEQYLGDIYGSGSANEQNWLVLSKRVQLTVSFDDASATGIILSVNGVEVEEGTTTYVGWVDPLGTLVQLSSSALLKMTSLLVNGQSLLVALAADALLVDPTSIAAFVTLLVPVPSRSDILVSISARITHNQRIRGPLRGVLNLRLSTKS